MGKYLIKRFIYLIVIFLIISVVLFGIFKSTPGDPALMMIAGRQTSMTPESYAKAYEQARRVLGLDDNIVVQYFTYIKNMVTLNFGYSSFHQKPVMQVAAAPLRLTVILNLIVIFFVFAISVPLGITTALKKGKLYDNVVQTITILGFSLPSFIFSILVIFLFAIRFRWFYISGVSTPNFQGTDFEIFIDRLRHIVLPASVLIFMSLASITRYVRATMIDAMRMDYIRTARAKGLMEKVVVYSHAFRNSLIPLVTVMVAWFVGIFAGSLVVESIFNYNGMGLLMINALRQGDWNVALAFNTFYMLMAILGNLLMDLMYMAVDPRVKLS